MIFNVLKSRWLRKQQDKLQKGTRDRKPTTPSSMVVLYNADAEKSILFLEKWAQDLGVKRLVTLGFTRDDKAVSTADSIMINSKTIKWSGGIADDSLSKVLTMQFDLQVNYFDEKDDLHHYLAMAINANFKVGIPRQSEEIYDLAIEVRLEQKETFIKELKKYLNIITQ
ncbi:DUF6913 domain-containing protein [Nonlabens antarcticus]|uniref:DUF6913 domain-containing protein n=1 Tax=Nonlabens antarcticus TaxID=392714 RepID=UPI001890DAA6|nr:hypothetical protein [Nonlabens antarcticus]